MVSLTTREAQLVELASHGLSNAAIGATYVPGLRNCSSGLLKACVAGVGMLRP